MLKIKDNVELKELKKYGFQPQYDEDTGTIKSYVYSDIKSSFEKILLIFDKKNTKNRILRFRKNSKDQFVLNEYCLFIYDNTRCCNFDLLYDLIKDGLVEKVGK